MFRSISLAVLCSLGLLWFSGSASAQQAFSHQASGHQAFQQQWATSHTQNWQRFYYYPFVLYPHNFHSPDFYQSRPNLYHRYPAEMRVPAYNRSWINFFPQQRRFHSGNHFRLDIF
jgi:hypothetical protein